MFPDWIIVAATVLPGARWCKVTDGAVAYTWANEVYARTLDGCTLELGPPVHVNLTTYLQQDEPEVDALAGGCFVVAWSDRSGQVGSAYMTAMFRILGPTLVPVTSELRMTANPDTSWRPLPTALPGGGFVAGWTEGWNEDAVWARFDDVGQLLAGPFLLHPPSGGSQNSPDVAPLRAGYAWAYITASATPWPRDCVAGWSGPHGPVRRSVQATAPGSAWEARVASNVRFAAVSWQDDLYQIWHRTLNTAPALIGCGRDDESALTDAGGLVVWDCAGEVMLQELAADGTRLGAPYAIVQGLAPTPAGETGRRQSDVWIAPDGSYALLAFGEWSGSAMQTRLLRLEPTP